MEKIKERAQAFIEQRTIPKQAHQLAAKCYINGAIDQRKIDIEKACEWMKENLWDDYNDCWDSPIEGSLDKAIEDFRKAMEEVL